MKQHRLVYGFWNDNPPTRSPFGFAAIIIVGLFNGLNALSKRGWCRAATTATFLTLAPQVLPVCMIFSDDTSTNAFRSVLRRGKRFKSPDGPFIRSAWGTQSIRIPKWASILMRWLFLIMALALLCPVLSKNAPCPSYPDDCGSYWTLTCRVGEASNPGPQIAFSTLNVVSMSRNQDLLKEPTTIPTVNVYTETCLTKTVLPSVKAKTKGAPPAF